jgi:hypothetical protein
MEKLDDECWEDVIEEKWRSLMRGHKVKHRPELYQESDFTILNTSQSEYRGTEREGKKPLVATWGGICLKWSIQATIHDQRQHIWNVRSELEQRLLAQTCEYCGSTEHIQVHHIRA